MTGFGPVKSQSNLLQLFAFANRIIMRCTLSGIGIRRDPLLGQG